MTLEKTIEFLTKLNDNNNLDWMHGHKDLKEEALYEFEQLVDELLGRISIFEPELNQFDSKSLMFRLNRDVRFSHDKRPYNPSFRVHMGPKGKQFIPAGYFMQIDPTGDTFIAGGVYATQFPEAIAMVRDYILNHGQTLEAIVNKPSFKKNFILKGQKLKNGPKGYDKESPYIEFLKHKSWYVEYTVDNNYLKDVDAFLDLMVEKAKAIKPLNDFLNKALKHFVIPKR